MENSHLVATFMSFGVVGLASIALTEKFIPIVPSYVMLILLGMTTSDVPSLVSAFIATALGSLIGSGCWYGIGRGLGGPRVETVVARFGRYALFRTKTYEHLANAYRRNQFRVTLIGQVVPVARIYLALPAGVLKLPFGSFITAAGIGISLWNAPFLTLGYVLRSSGHDPVSVGLWVSTILVVVELAVLCGSILHSKWGTRSTMPG